MPRMRVQINDLEVKRRKKGMATVSGIHYRALRDICTFAALHAHDSIERAQQKKKKTAEDKESLDYYQSVLANIRRLEEAIATGIANTFPPRLQRPITKAERWKVVQDSERERKLFDDILDMMRSKRAT